MRTSIDKAIESLNEPAGQETELDKEFRDSLQKVLAPACSWLAMACTAGAGGKYELAAAGDLQVTEKLGEEEAARKRAKNQEELKKLVLEMPLKPVATVESLKCESEMMHEGRQITKMVAEDAIKDAASASADHVQEARSLQKALHKSWQDFVRTSD